MPVLDLGSVVDFPPGFQGNASDTAIGGKHFNLTTLRTWNYTLYTNQTLSNGSDCLLAFGRFVPDYVFPNGSFTNSTSCYHAYYPIGTRGSVGLALAVVFALTLVATLVNLGKHGKVFLPAEKRFYPVGRRWQWYWAIFVCATAVISLLTSIDVDRYYLPEMPIILTSFFWFLMQQGIMAVVWEAARHWGSWLERQFVDPNPFVLKEDDGRAKVEFFMPLFFYFWLWLNFFLVVPRTWTPIEHQRFPEQIVTDAIPAATDGRFKAAACCLLVCWLTVAFSIRHSIQHYKERNRGLLNRAVGLVRFTPWRFTLLLPISLAVPAFQALVAWRFAYSPLNVLGDRAAIYAGGYVPALLILLLNCLHGALAPNDDLDLIRQRRQRGQALDREMGLVQPPAWWKRLRGDYVAPDETMSDRIARNVREVDGGPATATANKMDRNLHSPLDATQGQDQDDGPAPEALEMSPIRPVSTRARDLLAVAPGDFAAARAAATRYLGRSEKRRSERTMDGAAALLFPDGTLSPSTDGTLSPSTPEQRADLMADGPGPPPYLGRGRQSSNSPPRRTPDDRRASVGTTGSLNKPQQQVRSMLDV